LVDAIIRIYFRKDPDKLDDETWAGYFNEYTALKKMEYENLGVVIKSAISEFWNEINR